MTGIRRESHPGSTADSGRKGGGSKLISPLNLARRVEDTI